jgi:hypothetical protein
MKNFFFFVILIAGGFYFYKEGPANLFGPKFPSVYSTYKEFADHLAYARFDHDLPPVNVPHGVLVSGSSIQAVEA